MRARVLLGFGDIHMQSFCPGAGRFRQPTPEIVSCPQCGGEVEIWTDEIRAVCPSCGRTVLRDGGPSCLEWCEYARDCVGEKAYVTYRTNRAASLRRKLLDELDEHFGDDRRRIEHAREVLETATEILGKEKGADWFIVVPTCILHDVGIKPAEQKYGSSAPRYQEEEGPPVARKILLRHGLKLEAVDEICDIIAHHHSPRRNEPLNYRVVYDADTLVNLKSRKGAMEERELERLIGDVFFTPTGAALARRILLQESKDGGERRKGGRE